LPCFYERFDRIPDENEPYNKTIRPTDYWDEESEDLDNKETTPQANEAIEDDEDDLPF
tara:strand:- start:21356 stop:21529 length:174 start_codon:yes stop_codon:yes gene_type:complete